MASGAFNRIEPPPVVPGELSLFSEPARFGAGLHGVGEGTFAWQQPNGAWGESNAGLVVGNGEAMLVDTLWDLRLTRTLLDAVRGVTDEPIRLLVNTHSDGDHVFGNELVTGAEIISTTTAARLIAEENPGALERFRQVGTGMAMIGALPIPGVGSLSIPRLPHVPMGPIGRYFRSMIEPYSFEGITVTAPTRTFDGQATLDVGGRQVRLLEVGPAHTPGDLMVFVDHAGVVFTGDILFVGVTPIVWAGPIENWKKALRLLLDADVTTYVPGHGPVCGAREVQLLLDYWDWVTESGGALLDSGRGPRTAARELLESPGFRRCEWAHWDCPERLLVNLVALHRERRGQAMDASIPARVRLLAQAGILADAIA
ncbi:MAG: MBL fold metallo-hydrolase [Solirubrobacterales bacterium]